MNIDSYIEQINEKKNEIKTIAAQILTRCVNAMETKGLKSVDFDEQEMVGVTLKKADIFGFIYIGRIHNMGKGELQLEYVILQPNNWHLTEHSFCSINDLTGLEVVYCLQALAAKL